MKIPMFIALALSLSTAHAANPEQTRSANMDVTYASGFYEPTRSGVLTLASDQNGAPFSLTLSVQGRKLTAWVWQADGTRCGDRILARLNVPNTHTITNIELRDYTSIRCRLYVKHKWRATVDTTEADGQLSRLELEGDPSN